MKTYKTFFQTLGWEQQAKKKIPHSKIQNPKHLLDPNRTLKHQMKDASKNVDMDWDGDVDELEGDVPDEIVSYKKNLYKDFIKKYRKEKKHTAKHNPGAAFEERV